MTTTAAVRSFVTRAALIVQTYAVQGHDRFAIDHYEIHLAPDDSTDAPRTVLLTRDWSAYVLAEAAEGAGARVNARWHYAQRHGKRVAVLDTLEVAG